MTDTTPEQTPSPRVPSQPAPQSSEPPSFPDNAPTIPAAYPGAPNSPGAAPQPMGAQVYPPTGYAGYPAASPPAPTRRGQLKRWQWIALGVGSLLVVCCLCGSLIAALNNASAGSTTGSSSNAQHGGGSTHTQATHTAGPTATPAPTATNTPAPQWTTIQTFTGNGDKQTGTFNVPDDWRIVWSCDPSSSGIGQYNVIVEVDYSDGTPLDPAAINTICQQGNTGDNTEEHTGGDVYLSVISEGSWTLQAQTLQ